MGRRNYVSRSQQNQYQQEKLSPEEYVCRVIQVLLLSPIYYLWRPVFWLFISWVILIAICFLYAFIGMLLGGGN